MINQLLGDSDILPSEGEGSAVTAAPIEMRFEEVELMPDADTLCRYRVCIEAFSRKEFTDTRDQMTRDLFDYWDLVLQDQVSYKAEDQVLAETSLGWQEAFISKANDNGTFDRATVCGTHQVGIWLPSWQSYN